VGDKGDQGPTGPQGVQGEPGSSGKQLVLKDRFNQRLGIYVGQNVGESTSHYYAFEPSAGPQGLNLDFLTPNNHFSGEEDSAVLFGKSCPTPVYFSELDCSGAVLVTYDETCWEANSLTKMGNRYFNTRGWAGHPREAYVRSSIDQAGVCTNYGDGAGLRLGGIFSAQEITPSFTFPNRLPLKIVSE
jgi:hypothetical protein